jgi:hypothetical protein
MTYRVQRHCDECGTAYTATRRDMRFCSRPCAKVFANRLMVRGSTLVTLAMTDYCHRDSPLRKNGVLQKAIRRLLSRWRDEDRQAGRAHCADAAAILAKDMPLTMEYIYSDGGNPWSGASRKKAKISS